MKPYFFHLYMSCFIRYIECFQNVFVENNFHSLTHMKEWAGRNNRGTIFYSSFTNMPLKGANLRF